MREKGLEEGMLCICRIAIGVSIRSNIPKLVSTKYLVDKEGLLYELASEFKVCSSLLLETY